jgi:hypothetical protein
MSTAAERRAKARDFIDGQVSRAAHSVADHAFRLADQLTDAGHAKVARYLRRGGEAAKLGDRHAAEKNFGLAIREADKEGLRGASSKIDAIDAEFTVIDEGS